MNLATLRIEAQRLAGRVDSDWSTRTRRWLNEAMEQWALAMPWPTLVRNETFDGTGARNMILPARVRIVLWVGDRTNKRPVPHNRHWDRDFPTSLFSDTAGLAFYFRERGFVPYSRAPAIGALSFRTDVSDVFSVYVGGLRQDTTASGTPDFQFFDKENITVGGSDVASGTKSFVRVEVLGKDDFTPADVVVRDSASNVVARIPALGYRSEYRQIEFLHVPPAGTKFDVEYVQAPAPLVEDYQVPHPSVDPEYLVWYAASMIHSAQGQEEQAQVKMARAAQMLERRAYSERMHGDKDLRGMPSVDYWGWDDLDISGYNG